MDGLGGDDFLAGEGGADTLYGGNSSDVMAGGKEGGDTIYGKAETTISLPCLPDKLRKSSPVAMAMT